ncbi:DUF5675 family protein [Planctobacterium marinum]|uniref:DUF5675 domain-containing protein n=1 Tax=Planctobacterium marinum TaxID=1631968 RepID=A0AA48HQ25_9ALTE|nr:hypothetical protein MACH26_14300 [Planctobacterium marinum]
MKFVMLLSLFFIGSVSADELIINIERNMTCGDEKGEAIMGRMLIDGIEFASTLELPWRDNRNDISHIPSGTYRAFIRTDGSRGFRLELINVPGERRNVQIHSGNTVKDIEGCILIGDLGARRCRVTDSRNKISSLRDIIAQKASNPEELRTDRGIPITIKISGAN